MLYSVDGTGRLVFVAKLDVAQKKEAGSLRFVPLQYFIHTEVKGIHKDFIIPLTFIILTLLLVFFYPSGEISVGRWEKINYLKSFKIISNSMCTYIFLHTKYLFNHLNSDD